MSRNLLRPMQVQAAADGDHADGDGLFLRVSKGRASFLFRFTSPAGRRREMGLGLAARNSLTEAGKSLATARDAADESRALLRRGLDPLEERARIRAAAQASEHTSKAAAKAERLTLARAARDYHARIIEPSRSDKHGAQWIASLESNVPPAIWHAPLVSITGPLLLDALLPLFARVPETARRVRQRLEATFDDAEFRGHCSGNPARAIRRKLAEGAKRRERGHFAALPWREVPAFMAELRTREGIAARALELAVLTTARTGEVIGATWPEFDLEAGLWTVPAARMKGGQAHTVYLSAPALAILATVRDELGSAGPVFPAPRSVGSAGPAPLSNMAMLTLLRRMDADKRTTVHGLCRASFSTWANETGAARPDVIEACLAHREADKVRASYNRAAFAEDRRALLSAWSDYCGGQAPASNVFNLGGRLAA